MPSFKRFYDRFTLMQQYDQNVWTELRRHCGALVGDHFPDSRVLVSVGVYAEPDVSRIAAQAGVYAVLDLEGSLVFLPEPFTDHNVVIVDLKIDRLRELHPDSFPAWDRAQHMKVVDDHYQNVRRAGQN